MLKEGFVPGLLNSDGRNRLSSTDKLLKRTFNLLPTQTTSEEKAITIEELLAQRDNLDRQITALNSSQTIEVEPILENSELSAEENNITIEDAIAISEKGAWKSRSIEVFVAAGMALIIATTYRCLLSNGHLDPLLRALDTGS